MEETATRSRLTAADVLRLALVVGLLVLAHRVGTGSWL